MIGKLIYYLFKRQVLKYYFMEQSKGGFEKMQKCFVDSEGRIYYAAINDFDTPQERRKEIEKCVMGIQAGLAQYELDNIIEAMEKALGGGKKPDIARIGHLIYEMKLRKEMVMHPDLMFDLVAFKYIREDEDPTVINKEIHEEKIKQFRKDSRDGLRDFFYGAGLRDYIPYLTKLENEWDEYWRESEIRIRVLNQYLSQYLSGQESH